MAIPDPVANAQLCPDLTVAPANPRRSPGVYGEESYPVASRAPLTAEQRKNLHPSTFAGPGESYPINDKKHAQAALLNINKGGLSESEKAHVRARAHAMLAKGSK